MTTPKSAFFKYRNMFMVWNEFLTFCISFFEGRSEESRRTRNNKRKRTERQKAGQDGRTPQHQASNAAERAATSARPEGPSDESCRNKCRREERMLRAKRASSPEKLALPATATTSEQRSSTVQGLQKLI